MLSKQKCSLKWKPKRKLKKLQTDSAIAEQEAAITVLELKDRTKTLSEGKPAPREDNSLEVSCGRLPPVEGVDRKINLILDLSTQLSLQCEKITQMEEVLEKNERKIQQLEAERGGPSFARGKVQNPTSLLIGKLKFKMMDMNIL
ncbi:hypothetical protein MUG91_G243n6 [Manis pentadactyla]|nr:hypothetical protein MUG91_G243n6 [Manis pentadactyla]